MNEPKVKTVKDLIEVLQQYPPDTPVARYAYEGENNCYHEVEPAIGKAYDVPPVPGWLQHGQDAVII